MYKVEFQLFVIRQGFKNFLQRLGFRGSDILVKFRDVFMHALFDLFLNILFLVKILSMSVFNTFQHNLLKSVITYNAKVILIKSAIEIRQDFRRHAKFPQTR